MSILSSAKKPYTNLKHSLVDYDRSYSTNYAPHLTYHSSYYAGDLHARPAAQVWHESVPIQRKYVDYVPEQRIEYRPVERVAVDHIDIEHRTEFEPIIQQEQFTEWVPEVRTREKVEYRPHVTSQVVSRGSEHLSHAPYYEGSYGSSLGNRSLYSSGYSYPQYYSPYSYSPYSYSYGSYSRPPFGGYSSYGGYSSGYSRYSRPYRYY